MNHSKWQKFCESTLIETLRPGGAVLELGFMGGFSSLEIQKYHPQSHVIMGFDSHNIEEAMEWVKKKGMSRISVCKEPWDIALNHSGIFDAIFACPLLIEEGNDSDMMAPEIVRQGTQFLKGVDAQFPQIKKMRYTDSELEQFCSQVAQDVPGALAVFLDELEENEQIDSDQKERVLRKFHLPHVRRSQNKKKYKQTVTPFIEKCLDSHLRQGGRFACYFSDPTSKFEDPYFFKQIIPDIRLNFREWILRSPEFENHEALAIWIERIV